MHAELRLRDTTLMLGPENLQAGMRGAKSIGATPVTLYITENVGKVVAKAVKLGAKLVGPKISSRTSVGPRRTTETPAPPRHPGARVESGLAD